MERPQRTSQVRDLARAANAHRVPGLAAETAFFTALAVFPTLLTVVALLRAAGSLLGARADAAAVAGMTRLLRVVLTTQGTAAADAATSLLTGSSRGLLTVATLVALALMVRALRSVLYALGVVSGRRPRSWAVAATLAVVLLCGGAGVTAAAVQDPLDLVAVPGAATMWRVLRWPVMAVALFGWACLLLGVGLRPRMPERRRLPVGAALAVGGWLLASGLFPAYVSIATRLTGTIGALGGGLILLVWLYLLMLSLYLAAEFTRAGDGVARREDDAVDGGTRPTTPDLRGPGPPPPLPARPGRAGGSGGLDG